ncbi:MAG: glycosyltransferase family 9 protein, partial [Candidatus Kapaibacteriota bacterium]
IYRICQPQVVFFPRPRFEEAYYAYKTNVPIRIGSAYRWYSFLFTHKIKDHRKVSLYNESKYNLRMVEIFFQKPLELKYVKINVEPEALMKVESLLETLNIRRREFIILHPGSRGSSITWQPYKFGELAEILLRAGYDVVLTGISQEANLNQIIQNYSSRIKNLTGRLNLYEIIALISLSKGMVANSTGILHIGSVLEIPTVGLFPNTPHLSAKRWGPIGPYSTTISPKSIKPDEMDNMELIQPNEVFAELLGVISMKENA